MKPSEQINQIAQKDSGREYPLDRDWLLAILQYLDEVYEEKEDIN